MFTCVSIFTESATSGGLVKADTVSVCGQVRQGRRISFDADQWFTRYLSNPNPSTNVNDTVTAAATTVARPPTQRKEISCTLLRCAPESSPANNTMKSADSGEIARDISFANTAQFLLLSLESVHALTQVCKHLRIATCFSLHVINQIVISYFCR